MSGFSHKIALIIPTRNRPVILARLLRSIEDQTAQPDQVIIVDGSDHPVEQEIKHFLISIVSYMRVYPPSLTRQRNEGLKALREYITLVGYLDDDIVMEKDAVEEMLRFWERSPADLGGASFNITNRDHVKVILLHKLFLINSDKKGSMIKSGCNSGVAPILEDLYTQWLCGGATVWKRNIFDEYRFDEWYKGGAYWEDVDFSFHVSRKYKLAISHSAKVQHYPPAVDLKKVSPFIKTHTIQQYHFVKKYKELSILLFYWSILGSIIIQIIVGFKRWRGESFLEAWGNISGIFSIITGKLDQADEHFREEKVSLK